MGVEAKKVPCPANAQKPGARASGSRRVAERCPPRQRAAALSAKVVSQMDCNSSRCLARGFCPSLHRPRRQEATAAFRAPVDIRRNAYALSDALPGWLPARTTGKVPAQVRWRAHRGGVSVPPNRSCDGTLEGCFQEGGPSETSWTCFLWSAAFHLQTAFGTPRSNSLSWIRRRQHSLST